MGMHREVIDSPTSCLSLFPAIWSLEDLDIARRGGAGGYGASVLLAIPG